MTTGPLVSHSSRDGANKPVGPWSSRVDSWSPASGARPNAMLPATTAISKKEEGKLFIKGTIDVYIVIIIELWRV